MVNLKKWMAKVGKSLKSKSLTYTTKTVTTSAYGTASLGVYAGSDRLLEINTNTTDGGQQIVTTPLLVGSTYWVKCTNANTGNIVANTPVLVQLVTCPVSFFGGWVKGYLLHLTESLKSFVGRRWAYAEPQEVADEAGREGRNEENNSDGAVQNQRGILAKIWRYCYLLVNRRLSESSLGVDRDCNNSRRVSSSRKYWSQNARPSKGRSYYSWCNRKYERLQLRGGYDITRNRKLFHDLVNGITPAPERGWWCA